MNDAIVLLALSQVVCLGGMVYLYLQFQRMHQQPGRRVPRPNPQAVPTRDQIVTRGPRIPATPSPATQPVAVPVANRMAELGVDVATLARRMNKSEEEVRLMLRRQAARLS